MTEITVLDFMNYLLAHRAPVSGYAISVLTDNLGPDTVYEKPTDPELLELYNRLIAWKEGQNES